MIPEDKMVRFRQAFKDFSVLYLKHRFDTGAFDEAIRRFSEGDSLAIIMHIDFVANDWVIMNLLANGSCSDEVIEKWKEKWDEENVTIRPAES